MPNWSQPLLIRVLPKALIGLLLYNHDITYLRNGGLNNSSPLLKERVIQIILLVGINCTAELINQQNQFSDAKMALGTFQIDHQLAGGVHLKELAQGRFKLTQMMIYLQIVINSAGNLVIEGRTANMA